MTAGLHPASPVADPATAAEAAPDTVEDEGATEEEDPRSPLRRCIVTGERQPRGQMVRCVVAPDGGIVPDLAASLPARGLWVSARRDVVALALKKRAFERAARRKVTVPADLAERIEALLVRRCSEGLGLARRAGTAVAGFEKVSGALRAGSAGLRLEAADGAADGRRKLDGLAQGLPMVTALTAAELGAAFGREHVVHAVVGKGPLADRLYEDGMRLAGFRADAAPPKSQADGSVPVGHR